MLYLIIPPIIIILASIGLLFLLSRKGTEFIKIKASEAGAVDKNKEAAHARLKHWGFCLLEKATGGFKAFLLKFHDVTGKWINIIKEKKSRYAAGMKKETATIKKNEETVLEKISFVTKVEVSAEEEAKMKELPVKEAEVEEVEVQEATPAPMLSKEIIQPEIKKEPKEEYEKILIERIAENPRDLEAYERLGKYYLEQENYQDAKECYKQVLKLSPINRQARIKLKKIIRMLGH